MTITSLRVITRFTLLIYTCSGFTSPAYTIKNEQLVRVAPVDASPVQDVATSRSTLSNLALEDSTQTKLTPEQVSKYNSAIDGLPSPPPMLDVDGGWE